ncbi:SSI family serine proteinase inhibitor [Nonomuraea sp. NPDC050783]|uniref:SSI family serine proteinase inhibitor n=1 Tax=Nonomuraea sp. NPDC050783 TaxID=3154634 RepID=UPI003464ED25
MKLVPVARTAVRTAARIAAAGLCAAGLLAAPFGAVPAGAAVRAGAELTITVTPASGGAYRYLLTCDPDDGSHPRAGHACHALRSVRGQVENLNVEPGPCTHIYAPVDVEVVGRWYGSQIAYHREFPNRCVMQRTLGPVV